MSRSKPAPAIYRAHLVAGREHADRIAALLSELLWPPADAVGVFDAGSGRARIEAYFVDPPDRNLLEGLLAEHIGARGVSALSIEPIAPADWVAKSRAKRPAIQTGRFLIHDSHERSKYRQRANAIEIEASQAFGTGHHGSTTGCLLALDRLLKRRKFHNVLDLGTGTGVLAIATAGAGHCPVLATDMDPQAVEIARENVALNEVANLATVLQCAGFDHPAIRRRAPFDLILANILARPLRDLAPDMARFSRVGSQVVLSGITLDQAQSLAARYRSRGFVVADRMAIDGWATLTLRRRTY